MIELLPVVSLPVRPEVSLSPMEPFVGVRETGALIQKDALWDDWKSWEGKTIVIPPQGGVLLRASINAPDGAYLLSGAMHGLLVQTRVILAPSHHIEFYCFNMTPFMIAVFEDSPVVRIDKLRN